MMQLIILQGVLTAKYGYLVLLRGAKLAIALVKDLFGFVLLTMPLII